MATIRDIKRTARGGLHAAMSVPALYIPVPTAEPVEVNVRVWRKREDPGVGDNSPGGGLDKYQAAQLLVSEDRLRFDLSEIPVLRRLGVVSVETGEAYRIDHLYPADNGFQTARVVPLSASEAAGLPVPVIA